MSEMFTAREMLQRDPELASETFMLQNEIRLGEAWRALMAGKGVNAEDANALIVDLLLHSDYFSTAPPDATGEQLQRREGRREVMARILFLSDVPSSYITKLRRDLLDELQKAQS